MCRTATVMMRGDVEPERDVEVLLVALGQRPEEVDREHHPDHRDGDVDRPLELGVLLACVMPSGSVMAAATMIELPAPEVDLATARRRPCAPCTGAASSSRRRRRSCCPRTRRSRRWCAAAGCREKARYGTPKLACHQTSCGGDDDADQHPDDAEDDGGDDEAPDDAVVVGDSRCSTSLSPRSSSKAARTTGQRVRGPPVSRCTEGPPPQPRTSIRLTNTCSQSTFMPAPGAASRLRWRWDGARRRAALSCREGWPPSSWAWPRQRRAASSVRPG